MHPSAPALIEARRAERDLELVLPHHHRLPTRPKGRFRGRRRLLVPNAGGVGGPAG